MSFATINLEAGFPTVDDARRRLVSEMQSAKARGVRVIKVIHGWGSSGEGGKLGPAIRKSLRLRVKEGKASLVLPGNGSRRTATRGGNSCSGTRHCARTGITTAPIPALRWSSWPRKAPAELPTADDRELRAPQEQGGADRRLEISDSKRAGRGAFTLEARCV